ncbi:MAG TPA: alpha/beta hydrolase [Pseudomonadales bacterium]|nr:alpha/beta hydrolase [Pseudomonadales bacterium]
MTNESTINFSTLPKVKLPSIELAYIERGQGPLVLCMHGFPDNACTWLPTLELLAERGYRAVAPFTRGYYPSALAADGDYSLMALAQDILDLISAFGAENAIVIGHDWGGLAAITAANMAPEKISKLIVGGVPHLHKVPFTVAQLFRSWYVLLFQLPGLPEKLVARKQLTLIDKFYAAWSPQWAISAEHLDSVKGSLSAPGALAAALDYYRAMVRRMTAARWKIISAQTTVPTLVFMGLADGSTGHELFRYTKDCYTNLHGLVQMTGVGHFPHLENHDLFARKVLHFLNS